MSVRDSFGKPKEGGQYKMITLAEGESKNVRFFPPMKSMGPKGVWARYIKQHYGYGIKDKKNPDGKLRSRPFECIEEKEESGLVTNSCPECRNVENQEQAEKDAVALRTSDLMAKGADKKTIETEAANVSKAFGLYFKEHNLDCKWFIPVKTDDGQFGLLKIPHKGKKKIDNVRKAQLAKKKASDMLDIDNGFWVKVTRTGTGLQTEYDAEPVMETRTVDGIGEVNILKTAPLSDADLEQALASIPDLASPTLARRLTKDQIQMLVDSRGNPDVVETVLNMSQKVKTADSLPDEEETPAAQLNPGLTGVGGGTANQASVANLGGVVNGVTTTGISANATGSLGAPLSESTNEYKNVEAPQEDEEAALMKKLAAARAAKAAKAAATTVQEALTAQPKPAAQPQPTGAADPFALSEEDFLKKYGPGSVTQA